MPLKKCNTNYVNIKPEIILHQTNSNKDSNDMQSITLSFNTEN
jgi:hypothetical protein